jgi:hypothetical protein
MEATVEAATDWGLEVEAVAATDWRQQWRQQQAGGSRGGGSGRLEVKCMVLNITLVGKHLRESGANYCLACEVPLER